MIKQSLSEDQYLHLQSLSTQYEAAMILLNHTNSKTLTVYGGSRLERDSKYYGIIKNVCNRLGHHSWGVMTGGGPGAMEAGLLGVNQSKLGQSIAIKVSIAGEPSVLKTDLSYIFDDFAPRMYALRQADAFLFVPGGIGTFQELFDLIVLSNVGKSQKKPIILLGKVFWSGLFEWMEKFPIEGGLLNPITLDNITIVESAEEIWSLVL